jgi:hypothetical protein
MPCISENETKANDAAGQATPGKVSSLLAAERHNIARPQADIGISTESKAPEKELEPEEGKPEPTYDEVKKYILQISSKSRDKAVALLARYGAKGGPSLKPEQYASFVKDALATLAGVYDPEKGE